MSTVTCRIEPWAYGDADVRGSIDPAAISEALQVQIRQHLFRAGIQTGESGNYQLRGAIIRIDEGNRLLRYFLTGLGQVEIEVEGELCAGERVIARIYQRSKYGGLHFFGGAADHLLMTCATLCSQQIGKQVTQAITNNERGITLPDAGRPAPLDGRRRSLRQWQAHCETRLKNGENADSLRQEMLQDGYSPAEANSVLNTAIQAKNSQTLWIFGCSALLFFGGILFSFATYQTATAQGGSYFLWFGAVICGVVGFIYGFTTLRKNKPSRSPQISSPKAVTPQDHSPDLAAHRAEMPAPEPVIEAPAVEPAPVWVTPEEIAPVEPEPQPPDIIEIPPALPASSRVEAVISAQIPTELPVETPQPAVMDTMAAPQRLEPPDTPPLPREPVTAPPGEPPRERPQPPGFLRRLPTWAWIAMGGGILLFALLAATLIISSIRDRSNPPALALQSTRKPAVPASSTSRPPTIAAAPRSQLPTTAPQQVSALPPSAFPTQQGALSPQNIHQIIGLMQTNNDPRGFSASCRQVIWSSDSNRLIYAGDDVHVADLRTRNEERTATGQGWLSSIALMPDEQTLLVSSDSGGIQLWEMANNRELRDYPGKAQSQQALVRSPDGKTLAATLPMDDGINLYEIETGKLRLNIPNVKMVRALAYAPDGKILASGGDELKLWDAQDGHLVFAKGGHDGIINEISFSPDGRLIVTAATEIKIWDRARGSELMTLPGDPQTIDAIDFSPDGRLLASFGRDYNVRFWDMSTGRDLGYIPIKVDVPYDVRFSPDGMMVAMCGMGSPVMVYGLPGAKANLPTITAAPPTPTVPPANAPVVKKETTLDLRGSAAVIAWPKPDLLLIGGNGITAYNQLDGANTPVRQGGWVASLQVSPDQTSLASADYREVRISALDGQNARAVAQTDSQPQIAYSPDGKTLAVSINQAVRLYDTASGAELSTIPVQIYTRQLAYSLDGQALVANTGTEILFFDTTGNQVKNFKGHIGTMNGFAFSPDGSLLAAGGTDDGQSGKIVLWDVNSGQWLRTMTGHKGYVNAVAYSPDGRWLASAASDLTVRIWDVDTGNLLNTLTGHTQMVSAVAFSPAGDLLASGASDGVILWRIIPAP